MCCPFSTCFCIVELISLSPLLLALLMPIYGSLFGVYSVLRMSLTLYFYVICNNLLAKQLGSLGPCMSGLAFAMVSSVQFVIVPVPALWVYEKGLWLVEPALQIVEIIMVVTLTMKLSTWAMEFDGDHPPFGKIFVLTASMTSYTITPFLLWIFALRADEFSWLVYVVAGSYLLVTVATLYKDEGIISNAAIICLASAIALTIGQWERNCANSIRDIPIQPEVLSTDDKSLFQIILSMPQASLEFANQPIELFRKIFSPPFWFLAMLRVASAIWLVVCLQHRKMDEDNSIFFEDSDVEDGPFLERLTSKCPNMDSSLKLMLAAIFVYTQIVVVHLGHRSQTSLDTTPLGPTGLARYSQCFGLIGVYVWKLFRNKELWEYS